MHDKQRRSWMQKKQNFREKVAACSPDGKKITFVKPLEDMEKADYEAAQIIHEERYADTLKEEKMNRDQVKKQLKAVQKQNYSHIVNKNSLSLSDKRDKFLREQDKGLASVKLQDLVAPIDY